MSDPSSLKKAPTGIIGLDEVTSGGLPAGRITLLSGGPGTGKSLLAMAFLVAGAAEHDEPGLFVSFEEPARQIVENTHGLGWDVEGLVERGTLAIEHIRVAPAELEPAGDFDLEPLFVRLGRAIQASGARRVALDTTEAVLTGFLDTTTVRTEIARLFAWLKEQGVTSIVTAESDRDGLSRHGLEEFVSDCVIMLDNRLREGTSTRRLRIVKYRGSAHGSDEYPFVIDEMGFSVHPLTTLGLDHSAPAERISSGVERLDEMLTGGYYRGSTILVTGQPGSGKSSLAASFVAAACDRGERALYFALEESEGQVRRNMASIGMDLGSHLDSGRLSMVARRATSLGLESHLSVIQHHVRESRAEVVVLDPISSLHGSRTELESTLTRLIDFLKVSRVTTLFTMLVQEDSVAASIGVSSLADTWLRMTNVEHWGERNRGISIFKSRGMAHSNQVREFLLGDDGIEIIDAYSGPDGLLMGSARMDAEVREETESGRVSAQLNIRRQKVAAQHASVAAQIEALRADLAAAESELEAEVTEHAARAKAAADRARRREMGRRRGLPG